MQCAKGHPTVEMFHKLGRWVCPTCDRYLEETDDGVKEIPREQLQRERLNRQFVWTPITAEEKEASRLRRLERLERSKNRFQAERQQRIARIEKAALQLSLVLAGTLTVNILALSTLRLWEGPFVPALAALVSCMVLPLSLWTARALDRIGPNPDSQFRQWEFVDFAELRDIISSEIFQREVRSARLRALLVGGLSILAQAGPAVICVFVSYSTWRSLEGMQSASMLLWIALAGGSLVLGPLWLAGTAWLDAARHAFRRRLQV